MGDDRSGEDLREPSPQILIVEDNPDMQTIATTILRHNGYTPQVVGDGKHALTLLASHDIDVVVLDILLPGLSGLEVLAQIKTHWPWIEVIMLTILDEAEPAVQAIQQGAYAYIVKSECVYRLPAMVAQAWKAQQTRRCVHIGQLMVDIPTGAATLEGQGLALSRQDKAVLSILAHRRGQVLSYDELWHAVWDYSGSVDKSVVRRALSRLRNKVGQDVIVSVRGEGYKLL